MAAESLDDHARRRRRQRVVETVRERVLPILAVVVVGILIGVTLQATSVLVV